MITLTSVLSILVLMSSGSSWNVSPAQSGELTAEETRPLLQTLSKLYPLSVVQCSRAANFGGFPHLCFLVKSGEKKAPDFRRVREALGRFESEGEWQVVADFPQLAILVQPKYPGVLANPDAAVQFRNRVAEEIQALSDFLEHELSLTSAPSRGLDLLPKDLTLPGIEDHWEPHSRNIYLVREPERFNPAHGPTSDYDRILHFGLSEDQAFALTDLAKGSYTILERFYEPYKDQQILPAEIPLLESECLSLKQNTSDAQILDALNKILSICKSARHYDLGIFIDSD